MFNFQDGSFTIVITTSGISSDNYDFVLSPQLRLFSLQLCSNPTTAQHLSKHTIAALSVFLSNEEINAYSSQEIHLVLKCVINVLTLIEKQQQQKHLQHGRTSLHVPESLLIRQTYNEEETSPLSRSGTGDILLRPNYSEYLINMMKTVQIYLLTYQSLHDIQFEQCYMNKKSM